MRVLLVTMPFGDIDRPALGISLLKARLMEAGVVCDVAYLNLAFARLLGREAYQRIADGRPFRALAGDWAFAESLYGAAPPSDDYIDEILMEASHCEAEDIETVLEARALARGFIADQLRAVPWHAYDVVGFSSLSAQNVASLALARAVKEKHSSVVIAFGGANWQGVMGRELHRRFPFVDLAVSGEADAAFLEVVKCLARGESDRFSVVAGLVYRDHGRTVANGDAPPVEDLDALPLPAFDDFMEAYAHSGSVTRSLPVLLAETARGCWWAADHPCLFCSLSRATRVFRSKTPARILRELHELAWRWPCRRVELVDNVVSPAFFTQVLPELVEHRLPASLFLEVRPSASREHMKLLGAVRGSVQPGIESLNDHVLHLMGKGTRTLENLRFLISCKEQGVRAYWNIIHGFPGETKEDYEALRALVHDIRFLDPPVSMGPLSLDRFSSHFERSEEYGFRNVRPLAAYRHVYPFPETSLRDIAYSFDYNYALGSEPADVKRLRDEVRAWQGASGSEQLSSVETRDGSLQVYDTRGRARARAVLLDPLEQLLYRECGDIRDRDELHALARRAGWNGGSVEEGVDQRLASFVERGLMVHVDGRFLSLAVPSRERS